MCNGTVFCPTPKMLLVIPIFSRYCRKFLVTASSPEMTKRCVYRYVDKLPDIFDLRGQIFIFLNFELPNVKCSSVA
jgi:hypothetical protein